MNQLTDRLASCFRTVFPDLTEGQIRSASQATLPQWDSVASITLVNVMDDEFGMQFDMDELTALDSFSAVHQYLAERNPA